ncbi:MAG: hypothetical protein NTV97_15570 [Alphaproteobacteria bacterium]|nr:hypothetical protein [Alphaproteobacteria bacterium]
MLRAFLDGKGAARAKAAAGGPVARVGRLALDGDQPAILGLGIDARRGVQQRPGVGMARIGQKIFGRTFLDHFARVHHQHARADVGDHAEVVADQDDGGAEVAVQPAQQVEDLRLDRHVERGGRLVGDEERSLVGEAHGQHHALAHATGELVGKRIHRAVGRGHAHAPQQVDRAAARGLRGEAAVRRHRLDELSGNAQDRVQRRHGVLEHHGDLAAAHGANSLVVEKREVAALEQDRAADDPRRLVEQAHDRLGADALAGAGFAHDAQRLAGMHVEADAVDGADGTGIGQEPGAQIAHLEQGFSCGWHADRASRGNRRP